MEEKDSWTYSPGCLFCKFKRHRGYFCRFFLFQTHLNSSAANSNLFSVFHCVNFSLVLAFQTFFIVKKKVHMRIPKLNLSLFIIKRQQGKNTSRKWHGQNCYTVEQLLSCPNHGELHMQPTVYHCP